MRISTTREPDTVRRVRELVGNRPNTFLFVSAGNGQPWSQPAVTVRIDELEPTGVALMAALSGTLTLVMTPTS